MVKTVLKEIIIVLILCIAILLILGVLFYDYNPVGKVIPNKIAYTTPEEIKEELEEEEKIETQISIQNKIYVVDDTDLNIYKKSKTYNPSKENPFATTDSTSVSTTGNNNIKVDPNGQTTGGTSGRRNKQNYNRREFGKYIK